MGIADVLSRDSDERPVPLAKYLLWLYCRKEGRGVRELDARYGHLLHDYVQVRLGGDPRREGTHSEEH